MSTTDVRLDDILNDPFGERRNVGGVRVEDDTRFQHDSKLHVRFVMRPVLQKIGRAHV